MNPTIRDLQWHLASLGYKTGPIDGLYGSQTMQALHQLCRVERVCLADGAMPKRSTVQLIKARADIERSSVRQLTEAQYRAIFPKAPTDHRRRLNRALMRGCFSERRAEMFLAQIGHESAGLAHWIEMASGDAYNSRPDLGNAATDGARYKGRGPIQLTGRSNYRHIGRILDLALEEKPKLAASPKHGFMIAAAYWLDRNLHAWADRGDYETVTRRINGGLTHYDRRWAWLERVNDVVSPAVA